MSDERKSQIDALIASAYSPSEQFAGGLLWAAAENYAKFLNAADADEFIFADIAMRLHAGVMMKIDPAAATAYLTALLDRIDPALTPQARRDAETTRIEAWNQLRAALKLKAEDAAGSC